MRAFAVALDSAFHGRKATARYFDHPIRYTEDEDEVKQAKKPNSESQEQIAVYEMKLRCKMLEKSGLPPSPK